MSAAGGAGPAAELEQALDLKFRERGLLRQALTHRSYVNETSGNDADSYERLEFLGDVVVRLIVSEELYHRLPACDEGGLTRRWTTLLSQRALATVAERLGVAPYLLLGRGFESTGGRHSEAVLGDVMESLIAAIYLDAGYDAARRFVLLAMSAELAAAGRMDWRPDNPKAELQELLQGTGPAHPRLSSRGLLRPGPPAAIHRRGARRGAVPWVQEPAAAKTPPKPKPPAPPSPRSAPDTTPAESGYNGTASGIPTAGADADD